MKMSNEEFLDNVRFIISNNIRLNIPLFNDYDFYNSLYHAKFQDLKLCLYDDDLNLILTKTVNVSILDINDDYISKSKELFLHVKIQPTFEITEMNAYNIILYNGDTPVAFSNIKDIINISTYIDIQLSYTLEYTLDNTFVDNGFLAHINTIKILNAYELLSDNLGSIVNIIYNDGTATAVPVDVCIIETIRQKDNRLFIKCVKSDDLVEFMNTCNQSLIKTIELLDLDINIIEEKKYNIGEKTITILTERTE